ncbi:MAG: mannitol dehydrogenase family protein [Parvibaculaceae bacterium]
MDHRLSRNTLKLLPSSVARPAYDRSSIQPGILHLGVGAFHRAHQAVYVDDCLAAGETGWGIVGVSLRNAAMRDTLSPQDGLYTVAARGSGGEALRVVGASHALLVAPESPQAVLAAMADPRIRIVTLTVTEKAYLRRSGGGIDADHPDIVHDLANPDAPRTAHGFLVEALALRRKAGVPPFTVLSCDNLPANGATLRRLAIEFAASRDAGLARHVEDEVAFPSSMVDRIVPATTDEDRARIAVRLGLRDAWPVVTEPFSQWVVEDRFPAGRPDWERFGVTMTTDVGPFEEMKLRLLNGSHSAIAYLGLLSGHATVAQGFADAQIRRFIDGLWSEAVPTLSGNADVDPVRYTAKLGERYANATLVHRTAQIANDGSQKLPQRIIAPALERLKQRQSARHLMLVVAAWIAAGEARGAALPADHFTDPLDDALREIEARRLPAAATARAVFDRAGFASADVGRDRLEELVAGHLDILRSHGAAAALAALIGGEKTS